MNPPVEQIVQVFFPPSWRCDHLKTTTWVKDRRPEEFRHFWLWHCPIFGWSCFGPVELTNFEI